jgi:uncharacterized membrane protein
MEGVLFAIASFSNLLTTIYLDYNHYLNTTFGCVVAFNISAVYRISMFSSTVAPAIFK